MASRILCVLLNSTIKAMCHTNVGSPIVVIRSLIVRMRSTFKSIRMAHFESYTIAEVVKESKL